MVMSNHEEAFEGFTEIIDARDTYLGKNSRIAELLTELNRPRTEFFNSKRDVELKLRTALRNAIGTGITVAKRQQNLPLLTALKSYKKVISNISQHSLPEVASRVSDGLSGIVETVTLSGLSAERFAEFQGLISSFREIMAETDYIMSSRKTARAELSTLTVDCNGMLRDELDSFVENRKTDFTEFYNAYFIARRPKRRRKRKTESVSLCDISGTVTDSATGQPLTNAVINLLSPETITSTDADGYYLLEELEAGEYTVSCYLEGYDVPANVTVTAAAGESIVVDFSLTPDQQQAAA
jgi:hypothetical protein